MMRTSTNEDLKALGLVWINCVYPVVSVGLEKALEGRARVYVGREFPEEKPFLVILCADGVEGISKGIKRAREANPDASILVFGLTIDLPLVKSALQAGARGFIHAAMQPDQITRAVEVAANGELVAPRELLEYLLSDEDPVDLNTLSARQREVLNLVVEGLSNAEIARRLYLSESTVKQHLRASYKALGVSNRTEATQLLRKGEQTHPGLGSY